MSHQPSAISHQPGSWSLVPRPLPPGLPWRHALPGVGAAVAWLRDLRLDPAARLGIAGVNTPATAALIQAAPLAGVAVVLFNRRLGGADLRDQVTRSRVAGIVCGAGHPLAALDIPGALPMPDFDPDLPLDSSRLRPLTDSDDALVLFTSGTSGSPKAARLSVAAIRHAVAGACARLSLGVADRWLACLPLDHIGGASVIYRAAMAGYRLRLTERFAAATINGLIDGEGITGISVVPTMLHRLIADRGTRPWPRELRVVLTGGGPLSGDLIAACTRLGRAPSETYGLTECASQACTLAPDEAAAHPGCAGAPLPGIDLVIVDPGDDGVGRIRIRGGSLFSGYDGAPLHPPGEWFDTGDLGRVDDDGRLTVLCRRDDLILSGGENVYPAEVEAALRRHPAIRDAGVCGLPDGEWGQVVAAVLIAADARPDDGSIDAWLAQLSGPRRPRRWRWAAELPRTATGKLQRGLLPPFFAAGPDPSSP